MADFDVRIRLGSMKDKFDAYAAAKRAARLLRQNGYDVHIADLHPTMEDDERDYPAWND